LSCATREVVGNGGKVGGRSGFKGGRVAEGGERGGSYDQDYTVVFLGSDLRKSSQQNDFGGAIVKHCRRGFNT